jgi:hypothetical protein
VGYHSYCISIAGHVGHLAHDAFDGMDVVRADSRTHLRGKLDQEALFGLLARVQALALELVEVRRED